MFKYEIQLIQVEITGIIYLHVFNSFENGINSVEMRVYDFSSLEFPFNGVKYFCV